MSVRHLYLARHAEPDDSGGLTKQGVRQAELLGQRMAGVPLTSVLHGPLPRAARTARVVAGQLANPVPVTEHPAVGDYVPHLPAADEVDPEYRAEAMAFLADVSPIEAEQGAALAGEAVRLLAGPEQGVEDSHHLVVTHAFTIGWLVRHACAAPPWRWLGLNHGHAALTVLRYFPHRPPTLVARGEQELGRSVGADAVGGPQSGVGFDDELIEPDPESLMLTLELVAPLPQRLQHQQHSPLDRGPVDRDLYPGEHHQSLVTRHIAVSLPDHGHVDAVFVGVDPAVDLPGFIVHCHAGTAFHSKEAGLSRVGGQDSNEALARLL